MRELITRDRPHFEAKGRRYSECPFFKTFSSFLISSFRYKGNVDYIGRIFCFVSTFVVLLASYCCSKREPGLTVIWYRRNVKSMNNGRGKKTLFNFSHPFKLSTRCTEVFNKSCRSGTIGPVKGSSSPWLHDVLLNYKLWTLDAHSRCTLPNLLKDRANSLV